MKQIHTTALATLALALAAGSAHAAVGLTATNVTYGGTNNDEIQSITIGGDAFDSGGYTLTYSDGTTSDTVRSQAAGTTAQTDFTDVEINASSDRDFSSGSEHRFHGPYNSQRCHTGYHPEWSHRRAHGSG